MVQISPIAVRASAIANVIDALQSQNLNPKLRAAQGLVMATDENGLLAIEVNADDYAETAVGDAPIVSRTYQSEAAFQAQKATYTAKTDGENTYRDLIAAIPILGSNSSGSPGCIFQNGDSKVKLSKKGAQLLGYAVGELYYNKEYTKILDLCRRVNQSCEFDSRTAESLSRWTRRCHERLS